MPKKTVDRFFSALVEPGWVLYVPENLRRAATAGLLKWGFNFGEEYPSDKELEKRGFPDVCYYYDTKKQMPTPTIARSSEWREILTSVAVAESVRPKNLSTMVSYKGWVFEIKTLPFILAPTDANAPREIVMKRLKNEFGLSWMEAYHYGCTFDEGRFVWRKRMFSPVEVKNVRNRIEGQILNSAIDAIRVADFLKISNKDRKRKQ